MAKYNGLTFTPHRELTKKEKSMTLAELDKHLSLAWNFELGMFDSKDVHGYPQKFPYSHESFYSSMKIENEDWADIYFCENDKKYYIPCTHTVMEIRKNIH